MFSGKNFSEFPGNVLPKFIEILLILFFLKDKISAVTYVSFSENTGKYGGKFPGIFPEKIFRHFPEFPEISELSEFFQNFLVRRSPWTLLYIIKRLICAL